MVTRDSDTASKLATRRQGDLLLVRLPAALCYYEARAAEVVEALGRIAEDLHRQTPPTARGVLLLQPGDADDRQASWLAEIRDTCLFTELVHRVDAWRWLLSLVRNSPVPWVYAAAGDCQGSAWELALSCQRRYWYAAEAEVGFPEVTVGAFPPGGVVESLSKRAGRTRERWQARPVMPAAEALEDGLVHFCVGAARWEEQAEAMVGELLRVSPRSGVRDKRERRAREGFALVEQQSRQAAIEQLGTVWRHERMGSHKDPSAWDYCWQLVKERARLKQPGDLGRLLCLIASRHLLSPTYQAWVTSHLVGGGALETIDATPRCMPPVMIDLNYVAPPTEALLRLLRASLRVVFVAAEARDLAAGLNLLFGRLERTVGTHVAQALWDRGVAWYQGVCDESRSLVLRWAVDDRFLIGEGQKEYPFLRLEGNANGARPGLVEWMADPGAEALPPLVQTTLVYVADGLVRTRVADALPLTVHVRSLFLDEMLRMTRHADGDLGALTEALKASGWRFAGDDEAWDRFLRARLDAYPFDPQLVQLGGATLSRHHWEMGSWKHAKIAARRFHDPRAAAEVDPERRWSATATSQHFATYLGLLVDCVAASGRVKDQAAADHLSGQALGLPSAYGTPLAFLRQRGRRRVEHYAMTHWPTLARSGSHDVKQRQADGRLQDPP